MDSTEIEYPKVAAKIMKKLFKESLNLLTLKPWKTLSDGNSFVLVDPDSGQKQVVAVMGNAGELFGVHLYLPEEGTKLYTKIAGSFATPIALQFQGIHHSRHISLAFEELEYTQSYDFDLDDEFGGKEWIEREFEDEQISQDITAVFRHVRPHCPPWYIDEESALKLTDALITLQLYLKSKQCKSGGVNYSDGLHENGYKGELPTYRLKPDSKRELKQSWQLSSEEFEQSLEDEAIYIPQNDLFPARITKYKAKNETWQLGAVHSMRQAYDKGNIGFLTASMVVVESTGFVAGSEIHIGDQCLATLVRKSVESAVEQLGYRPTKIIVGSDTAELAMKPLRSSITIERSSFDKMKAHAEATQSFMEHMETKDDDAEELGEEDHELLEILQKEVLALSEQGGDVREEDLLKILEKVSGIPKLANSLDSFLSHAAEVEKIVEYQAPNNK